MESSEGLKPKTNKGVLGIDLGTTNSCVSLFTNSGSQVIDMEGPGKKTIPSIVRIVDRTLGEDNTIVGTSAKKYRIMKPMEVFSSVKSLMQDETWRDDKDILAKYTFGDIELTPSDIAEKILCQVLAYAQASEYGEAGSFDKAVICVPANSTALYKDSVKRIAKNVGFGVKDENGSYKLLPNGDIEGIYILAEPTAAALCYAKEKGICESGKEKSQNLLIYDFGGGTFDVTILSVKSDGCKSTEFDIKGTYGEPRLGGDDIDKALMEYVSNLFYDETGIDLMDASKDNKGNAPKAIYQAQTWLKEEAEKAKIEFSSGISEYVFDYPGIIDDNDADKSCNLDCVVSKEKFYDIIRPILDQTIACVSGALEASGMTVDDIDRFIVVGGSSKGPWVAEAIKAAFGRDPYCADNLDTIVSRGAAFYGSELSAVDVSNSSLNSEEFNDSDQGHNGGILIKTKTTHNVGVELKDGFFAPIIEKGLDAPYSNSGQFTNSNECDNIVVGIWATVRNLNITTLIGGGKVVYDPVHGQDEEGNDLFEFWGDVNVSVPKAPANSLNIELTLECATDNSIRVIAKVDGEEREPQSISTQKK